MTSVNLRHLHTFGEVARLGSVSAAARAVHISQPAVTQAVAGVERYFGAALLTRSNTGVALTPAGELCARRIERAISHLRNLHPDATRLLRSTHLHALAAVVEHRNFSLAARVQHVSQPSVHRAARELERLIGVPLFEKTSFGITPTREAEKLARRARLAFAEIAQARAEVHALSGGESGRTVIGAMPLARSFLVPTALLEFTQQYPEHHVAIVEGTYEHLLAALRSGDADFLIGALRNPAPVADVVQEHLFDDPLAIIVRAKHPLLERKRVTVSALSKYPWIVPRADTPLRAHFNRMFTSVGLPVPTRAIECNSLIAARALLLESDRIMLLSAHQIHYELAAGLLVALPHPAGDVERPIGLTMRHDWHPTDSQQTLLDIVRSCSAKAAALHAQHAR
ncbi:MAG TPA: LysR substrate-binding domain-containing protein [Steroidobacteraceae bacterium]|nr:LysR substrate-binding domain-containing protein [Steroidobacteraceae bacterium]